MRGTQYPLVTGLVARVGRREVLVPAGQVAGFAGEAVEFASARVDLRRFERREGEVLLHADVLGYRLIDVSRARLVRARDLRLSAADSGWVMTDYNLTTIPVVDTGCRMIGLITVDDVLEVTLREDWRRREAAEPPDAFADGQVAGDEGEQP